MAKKSMIEREKKRSELIAKNLNKRRALKKIISVSQDHEAVIAAQKKLFSMPANSVPCRQQSRCNQCGRPHAVYKKFLLCRICLRNHLMSGHVAGGRKASW